MFGAITVIHAKQKKVIIKGSNLSSSIILQIEFIKLFNFSFSSLLTNYPDSASSNFSAADVLLWRNKKISAGVLASATLVWGLFEWLNYNLLSLVCFGLATFMVGQFLWSNASGYIRSGNSSSGVFRVVLPEELFVNIAKTVGVEVNRGLGYLQDTACEGTVKHFAVVIGSLLAAVIIGSRCNFLTVLYIGFVAAHILPVLYEKYDDQIDAFVYNMLDQFQHHYGKLDANVLSKIPRGSFKGKKVE